MVDKENMGMEDAAGFFANVFGGERFKDYVSRPPISDSLHRIILLIHVIFRIVTVHRLARFP